jgi:hypothetical protein
MNEENFTKPLITSTEAAKRFGITNDYVTLLCRCGKIKGLLTGRVWQVSPESLEGFLFRSKTEREVQRLKLSEQLKNEYAALQGSTEPYSEKISVNEMPKKIYLSPMFAGALMLAALVGTLDASLALSGEDRMGGGSS